MCAKGGRFCVVDADYADIGNGLKCLFFLAYWPDAKPIFRKAGGSSLDTCRFDRGNNYERKG
jgi:hypothetical protein